MDTRKALRVSSHIPETAGIMGKLCVYLFGYYAYIYGIKTTVANIHNTGTLCRYILVKNTKLKGNRQETLEIYKGTMVE